MKGNKVRILGLLLVFGLVVFSPSLVSALSVSWQDDGRGNPPPLVNAMTSFVFLSGNSGNFGNPPIINQPGWIGKVVDSSTAIAYGPALAQFPFGMSVDFAGTPPATGYFQYFGYVDQTPVEGINMVLTYGAWTGNWSYLALGTAPPAPDPPGAVPEPATMLLLGFGLLGVGAFGRKFRK